MQMRFKNQLKVLWMTLIFSGGAMAQSMQTQSSAFDTMPSRGELLSNVVIDSQVVTAKVTSFTRLKLHLSCFATNLRSVGNPVTANSIVTAYLDVRTSSNAVKTIEVKFPADYLKPASTRLASESYAINYVSTVDAAVKISAYDNIIQLLIPNMKSVTLDSSGEIANVTEKNLILAGVRFAQGGAPNGYQGSYFGSTGPLSSNVKWYISKDGKTIDVYAAFPGAATPGMRARYQGETRTGFCGGYYSPLMLFFGEKTSRFTETSDFKLSENQSGRIYWPEKNSEGYFLVQMKEEDKAVRDGSQMFGDNQDHPDGFSNLASYDLNKDQVIDRKDRIFKSLRLWNDKNADGVSQAEELFTLNQKGVQSLALDYLHETRKFGERAEYKQRSSFVFVKDGKKQKGQLIDIWLSPAPLERK